MSVISKISNCRLLIKNPLTAKHIPETRLLTVHSLQQMLSRYRMVYLKPDNSCQGKGVIRVSLARNGKMTAISNDAQRVLVAGNYPDLWKKIKTVQMKRPYIVQQGIYSLTNTNHLFDLRVHLMRWKKKWVAVGIAGRIASKPLIVTNSCHGVQYKPVLHLLTRHLSYSLEKAKQTVQTIIQISSQAVLTISRSYPGWNEFGLDLGIDRNGRIWIYEINIVPSALIFKRLNNRVYHKIITLRRGMLF